MGRRGCRHLGNAVNWISNRKPSSIVSVYRWVSWISKIWLKYFLAKGVWYNDKTDHPPNLGIVFPDPTSPHQAYFYILHCPACWGAEGGARPGTPPESAIDTAPPGGARSYHRCPAHSSTSVLEASSFAVGLVPVLFGKVWKCVPAKIFQYHMKGKL